MIDIGAPLMSHDYAFRRVRDLMGLHGLIVVGMGKAGERGFQMLYRFSDICDRLEECGINLIFVYPRESARHVFDATSVRGARYRDRPCLFLDGDGQFFRRPLRAQSLRAVHLDRGMQQGEATEVSLRDATWDPQLRAFFAVVLEKCAH